MANMAYCRFNNTKLDMDECMNAIEDKEIASKDEVEQAKEMFKNILIFCVYNDIIEDYDREILDSVIENGEEE